ncbi:MAG: NUDIX domain-containing protein [Pseudomonadota bacterium]
MAADRSPTERYFDALLASGRPRLRVAGVILRAGRVLAQTTTDPRDAFFAFPGGGYELGDSFESRLARELEEETDARLVGARYGFVAESRMPWRGGLIHLVEHYLIAEIDRDAVESREPHLRFEWLPLETLGAADLRPAAVRDALATGRLDTLRHLDLDHA